MAGVKGILGIEDHGSFLVEEFAHEQQSSIDSFSGEFGVVRGGGDGHRDGTLGEDLTIDHQTDLIRKLEERRSNGHGARLCLSLPGWLLVSHALGKYSPEHT